MRREISPVIAIMVIVAIVAIAGGVYVYINQASTIRVKAGPGGLNAQSNKGPIPRQTFIPKAPGP